MRSKRVLGLVISGAILVAGAPIVSAFMRPDAPEIIPVVETDYIRGYLDGRNGVTRERRQSLDYYEGWRVGNCVRLDWAQNCIN